MHKKSVFDKPRNFFLAADYFAKTVYNGPFERHQGHIHVSVLIKGSPSPDFQLFKGLRQGCALSPLSFVLAEGLNQIIKAAITEGFNTGIKMNTNCPSHFPSTICR